MKWTYLIKNKLMAAGALFILCLLVLFSNYIDRNHTENVKKSISTLYEDRLIAEEYILKMTIGVYQLREVLSYSIPNSQKIALSDNLILNIRTESNAYQKTKFTEVEKAKAAELIAVLKAFESAQENNLLIDLGLTTKAINILNELSIIQLEESKQIMKHAEKLYISGDTSSQFVFAVIIVILIVLQALVFTSKTLIQHTPLKSHHLN